MPDIKWRRAPVLADIAQGNKIEILVLGVPGEIGEALAPSVIRCPVHAACVALPQWNLQTVVVAPAGVIDEIQTACDEGIEQEEIDRIRTRRISSGLNSSARTECVAEHAANVILVRRQSAG